MTTTTVESEHSIPTDRICLDDDVRGAIVHAKGADCARLHGLRITERRCSVCDQRWDDVAVSQHERCATVYEDGSRRYSQCIVYLSDGTTLDQERA